MCVQTSSFVPLESQDNGDTRYGCFLGGFYVKVRRFLHTLSSNKEKKEANERLLIVYFYLYIAGITFASFCILLFRAGWAAQVCCSADCCKIKCELEAYFKKMNS